jgi:hypothetical protein
VEVGVGVKEGIGGDSKQRVGWKQERMNSDSANKCRTQPHAAWFRGKPSGQAHAHTNTHVPILQGEVLPHGCIGHAVHAALVRGCMGNAGRGGGGREGRARGSGAP